MEVVLTLSDTVPETFSISPSRAWIREDLPAPTCPTTATSSFGFTLMLTLRRGGRGRRKEERERKKQE
jgi:hypothetical protein